MMTSPGLSVAAGTHMSRSTNVHTSDAHARCLPLHPGRCQFEHTDQTAPSGSLTKYGTWIAAGGLFTVSALQQQRAWRWSTPRHPGSQNCLKRVRTRIAVAPFPIDDLSDDIDENTIAGVTLGYSVKSAEWPPKRLQSEEKDAARLALDRLEGRRSGMAGAREVPPLHRWPVYEISIDKVQVLAGDESELGSYMVLDWTRTQEQAFKLAKLWTQYNTGRSLNFTKEGTGKLTSSVTTLPILMRQLLGLSVFTQWIGDSFEEASGRPEEEADLEEFLREKDADEDTANELRIVLGAPLPVDGTCSEPARNGAEYLRAVHVDAIIGQEKGSALAVWSLDPESRVARVDFCIGHDCLENGPYAEEMLIRLVSGKAAKEGAEKLKSRVRFTAEGKLFTPEYINKLGFLPVHPEEWKHNFEEHTDEEEMGMTDFDAELVAEASAVLAEDTAESVSGLRVWLTVLGLQMHLETVNKWCEEMGAATLQEVIEEREDLVEYLGDLLSEGQKQTLREREY